MSLASYPCSTPGHVLLGGRRSTTRTGRRGRGRLLAARVALEDPRRRELAELVADHVLGHEQLHELPAVVNLKRLSHELRHDRAVARPGADRLAAARRELLDLGQQPHIDIWAFFQRSTHIR